VKILEKYETKSLKLDKIKTYFNFYKKIIIYKKRLRRIDTPYGRAYAWGEGEDAILMPSVTTILSFEPSEYISDLEAKIGKEELDRIGRNAAVRGTAMHLFLENFFICRKNGGDDVRLDLDLSGGEVRIAR
jgi:hypothetical protein